MAKKSSLKHVLMLGLLLLGASGYPSEFPNYFNEKELIQQSHQVPGVSPDTTHLENLIEQALFSIIRRLQVPHVDGKNPDGTPKIVTSGFFEKVEAKVKEKDPQAKVYAAGGVVRSLLGYIYKKVYNAHQKTPPETTEQILNRIIKGEKPNGDSKNEILSLAALGVGSDLDILIETTPEGKAHEKDIVSKVTKFINSAEDAAGLRGTKTKLKYAIVPIGDVKSYGAQIDRTTSQGGSTLDWLAFPLTRKSGEHMRMPEGHPDIFKKFLLGEYDYLPPSNPSELKDPDKQTIRGLRALLEVPYLHLSKAGEKQMKIELDKLITKVERGEKLSSGAYEQFEKMLRNSRFEGAHNRFYSLSPQASSNDDQTVETLVYKLSEAYHTQFGTSLLKKFIVNNDPQRRHGDRCGLKASGLLMNTSDFVQQYTDQGKLYQGTPNIDNMLSMMRNGLMVDGNAGAGGYYGVFSTPTRSYAQKFGIPIEYKLKQGVELRVINTHALPDKQRRELEKKAASQHLHLHNYLSQYCDIDFILAGYPIIVNSGAVELPKTIRDLIEVYATKVKHPENLENPDLTANQAKAIVESIVQYEGFKKLGKSVGLIDLIEGPPLSEVVTKLLKNKNPDVLCSVAEVLTIYPPSPEDPHITAAMIPLMNDQHPHVRDSVARALGTSHSSNPQTFTVILNAINDQDPMVRRSAALSLLAFDPKNPKTLDKLVTLLRDSDSSVRRAASLALGQCQTEDHQILSQIVNLLRHPDPLVRSSAAEALGRIKPKDPKILDSIIQLLSDPDNAIRQSGIWALHLIQPADPQTLNSILKVLNNLSLSPEVRGAAALALGQIKQKNSDILKALVNALQGQEQVASFAGTALAWIDVKDHSILDNIVELMHNSNPNIRHSASEALKDIKPIRKSTLLALVDGLNDTDQKVRQNFSQVIAMLWDDVNHPVHQLQNGIKLYNYSKRTNTPAHCAEPFINTLSKAEFDALIHSIDPDAPVRTATASDTLSTGPSSFSQVKIAAQDKDQEVVRTHSFSQACKEPHNEFLVESAQDLIKLATECSKELQFSDESQSLTIHHNGKEITVNLDKKGLLYRSVSFGNLGKIQFNNNDVEKVLIHLRNGDDYTLLEKKTACGIYECKSFKFSNGDIIRVYSSEAELFESVFSRMN